MTKKISILLIILILFTLCFTFIACDDDEDEIIWVEEGATKITFYARSFEDWANKHLEKLVNEFNSDLIDGIQVDVKFYNGDEYSQVLVTAKEIGKSPDIFMLSYGEVYSQYIAGNLAPIDEYISEDNKKDLVDNAREMVTFDGKMLAYPWNLEPAALFFYRKDMLESAGVTKVPTTWAELYDACAKVKNTLSFGQYALGLPFGTGECSWVTYGLQQHTTGGLALDEAWKTSLIGSEGYKELARFFYTIYKNGYSPSATLTNEGYTYIVDALCENKLAMTWAGSWCIAEIYQYYPEMADKIGVSVIPTIDGDTSKTTSSNGGWAYGISNSSKNKDLAAKFINWMFTENTQRTAEYFIKAYNSKAATSKTVNNYLATQETTIPQEWLAVVNDVASKAIPEATYPFDISAAVGKIFETMQVQATETGFDQLYATSLVTAQDTIATVMSRTNFPENPKYTGK